MSLDLRQGVTDFDNDKFAVVVSVVSFALRDFGYALMDQLPDFLRCDAGDCLDGSYFDHGNSPLYGRKKAPDRNNRGHCGSDAWVKILRGTAKSLIGKQS